MFWTHFPAFWIEAHTFLLFLFYENIFLINFDIGR